MAPQLSATTYHALSANRWRTAWLMLLFPAMIATITMLTCVAISYYAGYGVDYDPLMASLEMFLIVIPYITVGATVWVMIALLGGRKIILAFAGAKPIKKADAPELYRIVENLAIQTGIPTPKIYIIEDESMNAFATGYRPENSAVAITRGLLNQLEKTELEAVMAHEFGHILHRDTRIMLIAVTMVGMIQLMAELIIRSVLRGMSRSSNSDRKGSGQAALILFAVIVAIWFISFLGAIFVQMGISRRREYMADAESAHLTRNPGALVSALQKISKDARVEVLDGKRTIAAMCIADPLEQKKSFFDQLSGLFATHPPIKDRVSALEAFA